MEKLTGENIGVAVLDTGIYPHMDLRGRIVAFYDVVANRTSAYDDNSHGTHVSGIIGGDGKASGGKYAGVAVKANFIGVKILKKNGKGTIESAIKGIEWVIKNKSRFNIRVVNISFAAVPDLEDDKENPLITAVEELWDKGMVVVTSAGNKGPEECSIGVPGNCRRIITVGAYDGLLGENTYSARGCSDNPFVKPEIVAKGSKIISCSNSPRGYVSKTGTSMAAPYVSGMIACLLQKYPDMEPIDVKLRLHDRAVSLGLPQHIQGWGTINSSFLI